MFNGLCHIVFAWRRGEVAFTSLCNKRIDNRLFFEAVHYNTDTLANISVIG
jgi:hypothetical protein